MPSAIVTVTATPSAIVNHTSSLSTGAKAGIGICAALAAVAITALAVCVVLLKKRSSGRQHGQVMNRDMLQEARKGAANMSEMDPYSRPHEIGAR